MTHYVPKEIARYIDTDSLQLQKDSFIQKKLAEYYSDVLFSTTFDGRDGYLYILFEHKSYPDSYVSLQPLRYIVEIWEMKVDKEREEHFPVILPIVIYHGEKKWLKPKTIEELIDSGKDNFPDLRQYIPSFKILFYNFSHYGKIGIKGTTKLKQYLQLIKHLYGEDKEALYAVIVQIEQAGDMNFFESVIIYLVHVLDSFSIDTVKERLTVEGRRKIVTAAEQWLREGEQKGEKRSLIKVAKRMIAQNKTDEEIMQLTDLTKKEVEDLLQ